MPDAHVRPNHKAVKEYYRALEAYAAQDVDHELAVRSAFQNLLDEAGRKVGWTLIPELSVPSRRQKNRLVTPDGTFRDEYRFINGHWEAKDTRDNLDSEIQKKINRGYPLSNIIFEDTREAVLFQNGKELTRADMTDAQKLCDLLNVFFDYAEPAHDDFNRAVDDFKVRVPDIAEVLVGKIEDAHKHNANFQGAFADFFALCQGSLNPNISEAAVDEMLVQHLLTERLIRRIFDVDNFTQRNVIAHEVERVIDALASRAFSRHEFLKALDPFYNVIEAAAESIDEFSDKQHFLNTIYERFFQGYSVKVADTHGIVYTPQEIVDFMCASVAEVLESEFGKGLGDRDVHILDPCTGTGNFIVNLMRRIPRRDLPRVYREQLFANEVMLMPYYIAALNIEHAYYDITGEYEPFEGLCFVDSLDLAEDSRRSLFTEANTERVDRQRNAPITLIIGNPPYNASQVNENDNAKNRKYDTIDKRIKQTYVRETSARKTKCYDPYVRFFRWASDRLGKRDGIVCFITNNSFVHKTACDGLRNTLPKEYDQVFHLDLRGDVQLNPDLPGTTYNVFGIKVGVGITIGIRKKGTNKKSVAYQSVPLRIRREKKLQGLQDAATHRGIHWTEVDPSRNGSWFESATRHEIQSYLAICGGDTGGSRERITIFDRSCPGVSTNRDSVVYDFQRHVLEARIDEFADDYAAELHRYLRKGMSENLDEFLDTKKIKWSRNLKREFRNGNRIEYSARKIRRAAYRPFGERFLYFDEIAVDELGQHKLFFGESENQLENVGIAFSGPNSEKPFMCLVSSVVPDLHLVGAGSGTVFCPFYVYSKDGTRRRENVTDSAVKAFRTRYKKRKLSKWNVMDYVYGLLHHPAYRAVYTDDLKRELPGIPFAPDFSAFAAAGHKLAMLHLNYEQIESFELEWIENPDMPLSYHVEQMRLSKDKTSLKVNDSLTLAGIPPEVFEYRLGNRSALEWVIDQYRIKTDKRSGITSDPNRADDPEYIVRLVGQVVRVSLETVRIVRGLPEEFGVPSPPA